MHKYEYQHISVLSNEDDIRILKKSVSASSLLQMNDILALQLLYTSYRGDATGRGCGDVANVKFQMATWQIKSVNVCSKSHLLSNLRTDTPPPQEFPSMGPDEQDHEEIYRLLSRPTTGVLRARTPALFFQKHKSALFLGIV